MVADINKTAGIVGGAIKPSTTSTLDPASSAKKAGEFGDILKTKVTDAKAEIKNAAAATKEGLKFSQHALERMASRGISIKPEEMLKLNEAVEKAAQKGSRESLVLMGDSALIVSVKNKTVVTAMDREAMKENVFTNIDSTVIL